MEHQSALSHELQKQNVEFDRVRDLPTWSKLPLSWWYSRTRETGPDSVPRIKAGRYPLFDRSEVQAWLRRRYGIGGEQ